MDDDEEIQSPASAATGSPSSSPPNGRITVTVAAAAAAAAAATSSQPPINNKNSMALALPVQQQAKSNGGGREDCWSEGATAVLIDAWGERYLELSRGNLKQKHWKEVADIVSSREDYTKSAKTDIQCKNRIDTVKKKYKLEKAKIVAGNGPSKWPFFQRLDHLIGPTAKIPVIASTIATDEVIAGNKVVPVGIPVGTRSHYHVGKMQMKGIKNQNMKGVLRKRNSQVETESDNDDEEEEGEENFVDSDDSLPLGKKRRKGVVVVGRQGNGNAKAVVGRERKGWGNSIRMLTQAILKFGEAYEQAESVKLQQVVEMEKTRMKFAKEMELQRMQFFMKTQMEISQLKRRTRGGNGNNHHSGNNNIIHMNKTNNNNSDSDN